MLIYSLFLEQIKKIIKNAATSLEEYRDKGYLDSAILNTLARLGWSQVKMKFLP